MLRRLIAGASAGLLLAGGLVSSPAEAAPALGQHHAADQALKPSCAHYPYRYRIDPPTDDWSAEIFLMAPRGVPIASAALDASSDPAAGKKHWRLCRPSITPGRYKIRMKVTYLDGYDKFEGFVRPSYFRLVRRR